MNDSKTRRITSPFEALALKKYELARRLFLRRAKETPCWETCHNLGSFFTWEQYVCGDLHPKLASLCGWFWLKKALRYEDNLLTRRVLGRDLLQGHRYRAAAKMFAAVYERKPEWGTAYDCGVGWYMSRDYERAARWFRNALELADSENRDQTWCALAFALLLSGKPEQRQEAEQIADALLPYLYRKRFLLFALAGRWEKAETELDTLLNHGVIELDERILVMECLNRCGRTADMEKFYQTELEQYANIIHISKLERVVFKRCGAHARYRQAGIARLRPQIEPTYFNVYTESASGG